MKTVITLGQSDPFSQSAVQQFKKSVSETLSIDYCGGVKDVFRSIGSGCDYGIVPIETMIDGHFIPVLELLLQSNHTIVDEIIVPATYGCISSKPDGTIRTIYTTYTSSVECTDFISSFIDIYIYPAPDIISALQKISEEKQSAALIPTWMIDEKKHIIIKRNVSDYQENSIRFIVLAEQEQQYIPERSYKTSMVLLETIDRPGVLSNILHSFSSRSVNCTSIISRPTREHFGTYHFFIDCSGHVLSTEIQSALTEIKRYGHIKLLGSYPSAETLPHKTKTAPPDSIPCIQHNPFRDTNSKPRITIAAGNGPYRNTLGALATFDLSPVAGKRVLLKPNVGRIAGPYSGVITNPQVVAAAIDAFRAAGAEVAIGESPITGVDLDEAYKKSGIHYIAYKRNCPLIDMDKRNPVEIEVRDGSVINRLKICADIFNFDIIISIPVMKMHMHTGVTLSVKNMKGCLWRRSKVELHMLPRLPFSKDKSLNIAIADMASVLLPHFAIIDGTVGMEGLGPSSGDPMPLDMVIVGNDAIAADAIACTIMGVSPGDVPHLRIASERGYGSIDSNDSYITNPDWRTLCRKFAPVPDNITMDFPRVKILDEQSCSACQSTVMLFMKRYGAQLSDYLPDDTPITIAIGKGHKGVPSNTICVGNCTRRFRDAGLYIPGCPPVASTILQKLKKHTKQSSD